MADFPPHEQTVREMPAIRVNSEHHDPFIDHDDDPYLAAPAASQPVSRTLTPSSIQHSPSTGTLQTVYASPTHQESESTEFLIPPRQQALRDEAAAAPALAPAAVAAPYPSPDLGTSYRRGSWESDPGNYDANGYPPYNPFEDSRAPSRADTECEGEGEDVNTQTVSEKYNIMPMEGLLLFPHEEETDDHLHNPNEADDMSHDCDVCNRRGLVNVGGLLLLTLGFLTLFVGYPVITAAKKWNAPHSHCEPGDNLCLDVGDRPLIKNIRTGLIDPDTPKSAHSKKAADGKEWKLVFSDEFTKPGRSFYDGDDPYYQGVDLWYGVTQDLEWYDPDAVTTKDGVLELRFDAFKNHDLKYRSGMVQSWNKLCFSGGRLEASISLPGAGDTSGFWPGFWAMGNLGRPGYAATTEGMWPYSYHDECDAGITPNQSSPDGLNFLPGMRLPACTCEGSKHPSPGRSRGAPEIDVIEASVGPLNDNPDAVVGSVSQSLQMAPFDVWYIPDYEYAAVYDPKITQVNSYRGGPLQQAMSGLTNLNNDWYNGTAYQTYAFEYKPGPKGDITWFVGHDKTWTLDARAIGANGNVGQRTIPTEPLAIVMNLGMAWSFAPINDSIEDFMPAFMRFDYVRIYQDPDDVSVTCDPPGYETTKYIEDHPIAYKNMNKTTWADTGYEWPKNSLMHGCTAEKGKEKEKEQKHQ